MIKKDGQMPIFFFAEQFVVFAVIAAKPAMAQMENRFAVGGIDRKNRCRHGL
ncbi:MAG: hypothetical protein JWQ21_2060 [Herminiimonas sp.]|nr:hypothetical protein [Herminiimonas sp.]